MHYSQIAVRGTIAIMIVVAVTACHTKETLPPAKVPLADAIKAEKFNLYKVVLEYPLGTMSDITATKSCQKEDTIDFSTAGAFNYVNQKLCYPVNNSIFLGYNGGSWSVTDTVLTLAIGFYADRFHAGVISSTSMELTQRYKNYFGEDQEYHYYLKPVQ